MSGSRKTAVSLDESVFEKADLLASTLGLSRSGLYEAALKAFIAENENRMLLRELDDAYADGPTREELEGRKKMRSYHRRQVEGEWK
ncbi:MAG: hypothetical protein ACYC99_13770 [Candidatus Geothermincolia bacterium]